MGKTTTRIMFLAAAMAFGCSTAELTSEGGGVLEDEATETELMYLLDQDAAQSAFADGTHELVPAQSFQAVDLIYVDPAASALEYQVLIGGMWTDWQPVVADEGDSAHRSSVIRVAQAGRALRLRGGADLDFARFEFFATAPPEHAVRFDDDNVGAEDHNDDTVLPDELQSKRARAGRWQISAETARASGQQDVRYQSAPAWSGGRNCSGRLLAGTRELGEYLVANFRGGRTFQGYACRQIRGSSGMSMHGTGRALDLFVPLDGGQADNDLGDPIAAWLIANAESIGIQLIIWDRSIWSTSRSTRHRSYGGAHPHHDHLHIELTAEGAAKRTAFFNGGAPAPGANDGGGAPRLSGCSSSTLGRSVEHGECVQMAYARCGGTCNWAICDNGGWVCQADLSACGAQHANRACAPVEPVEPAEPAEPPPGRSCRSTTLGRQVPDGEAVQMAYDACGGTCRWAVCDDGGWDCVAEANIDGERHGHASCQPQPEPEAAAPTGESCYSRTLGRSVPDGDRVQMAYAACGNQRRCNWAICDDGDWTCTANPARGSDHGHPSCN